jgi:hypothetical protein
MQGGIDPKLPGTAYFDLSAEIRRRTPDMHIHAFSPMEIVSRASHSGMPVREWLVAEQEAGVLTIPGTAAEILDDDVRSVHTMGKPVGRRLGRGRKDRARVGHPLELHDDVRPRRRVFVVLDRAVPVPAPAPAPAPGG